MSRPLLSLRGLAKHYGTVRALDGVDLDVSAGAVFGFLGPNGAGKTTAIRILAGLARPTRGEVLLDGRDLLRDRTRAAVGFRALVEVPAFHPGLTGLENLLVFTRLARAPASDAVALLERLGLAHAAERAVGGYSLGMRQRLGIAQALVGQPRLVVLDEPMNGLDPAAIHLVRELVRERAGQHGVTFFLSSHLLHDVETLCSEVGILHRGKLVAGGRMEDLLAAATPGWRLSTADDARAVEVLSEHVPTSRPVREHDAVRIEGDADVLASAQLVLAQAGLPARSVAALRGSLERTFLDATEGVMG
ncbi:MAG: ABC transporter ATP-binding protein [Planctomycetota bacterium]